MAGVITHIVIGMKVVSSLGSKMMDEDGFYLGTIAPDAIMSKKDYRRDDKKITHLRYGISSEDWYLDCSKHVFNTRIEVFIKKYLQNIKDSSFSFNLGYLVHLLTDQLFHYNIRKDIVEKAGLPSSGKELFKVMTSELDAMDFYLLTRFKRVDELLKRISVNCHEDHSNEYISSDLLSENFNWITSKYSNKADVVSFCYMNQVDAAQFVDRTSEWLIKYLNEHIFKQKS